MLDEVLRVGESLSMVVAGDGKTGCRVGEGEGSGEGTYSAPRLRFRVETGTRMLEQEVSWGVGYRVDCFAPRLRCRVGTGTRMSELQVVHVEVHNEHQRSKGHRYCQLSKGSRRDHRNSINL